LFVVNILKNHLFTETVTVLKIANDAMTPAKIKLLLFFAVAIASFAFATHLAVTQLHLSPAQSCPADVQFIKTPVY
jgi:hypothetical protein